MITKEDAKSYFDQMLATELKMARGYKNLHSKLKDSKLKKRFEAIEKEEYIHYEAVNEMKEKLEVSWKG
ncbi:MAG: hypothetical protein K940chlam1_00915 [Candidatus Anoxychlamydiales bacterium]|nr:hypothetical protein [Candidatus Anoxychlamydiales bacterium]NGX35400.1 hypothetical protein [Candidatus Anoxychlamydiales bacterium]